MQKMNITNANANVMELYLDQVTLSVVYSEPSHPGNHAEARTSSEEELLPELEAALALPL